jgi:hypothetical protein
MTLKVLERQFNSIRGINRLIARNEHCPLRKFADNNEDIVVLLLSERKTSDEVHENGFPWSGG